MFFIVVLFFIVVFSSLLTTMGILEVSEILEVLLFLFGKLLHFAMDEIILPYSLESSSTLGSHHD